MRCSIEAPATHKEDEARGRDDRRNEGLHEQRVKVVALIEAVEGRDDLEQVEVEDAEDVQESVETVWPLQE